ncbi:MAG: FAD-dependent monooxygenase [Gemmataceae bacterium]|nr:FAD-dependent monooxygenase [Gemmataceae bacterium]
MGDAVTVVGSGLAGAMLACLLGKAGRRVDLRERRPDPRSRDAERGRSINLALSTRGLHALDQVGLAEEAKALGVLMRGRMIHPRSGPLSFQPYGNDDTQALHSVPRAALNRLLVERAAAYPGVRLFFDHRCTGVDLDKRVAEYATPQGAESIPYSLLVGADGAWSAVRAAMQRREGFDYSQSFLPVGYKELAMPPGPGGSFLMEKDALHIWPRGEYMMIALPNADGSFTCTLFWPSAMFDALETPDDVEGFFQQEFPDAVPLLPDLGHQYFANPTGPLVTIRCHPWHVRDAVLLGDAAHAVVPFLGQGMNAAFEDCVFLAECLDHPLPLGEFQRRRKEHVDALADLCLDNYEEMKRRVGSLWFRLGKRLDLFLHRLLRSLWMPLYTMVEFTRIPYGQAVRRARRQNRAASALVVLLLALIAWGGWLLWTN